ncbi:DUF1846 domain-containing protein [Canibacter oris]|uniref:Uncharacterized protein (UPF0371 family) n=1 Tax=Canibacter oris TaxID=1365628 RepID=A0A840DF83_9MICO|nr:DUF1846 domain-containing protein [Canibacter oris]MBB4071350.1 uncharacterized protein (UPF0371 family) [Canibacter oris]
MRKQGFNRDKYIALQSEHIAKRRQEIGGKLYLEMGGKLFDDMHASRVLPGFTPDNKIAMLHQLADELEILIAINAKDIQRNKVRADLGITYEEDVLRLVDVFRAAGFLVQNIVITQFEDGNSAAKKFKERLQRLGLHVAEHRVIPGYPLDTDVVVSESGFGQNDWVATTRDLIVVTAPGPGSGKLATCLSQIYGDHKRGITSSYAKFETFPIWNLPLDHPVNLAYEAATADLDDVNMIDPFHLQAYGESAVNYNRDIETFPLLKTLLEKLTGSCPYQSPTDMGVNMVGLCIEDDTACRSAAEQEVVRRYYKALVQEKRLELQPEESARVSLVLTKLGITPQIRPVIEPAQQIAAATGAPAAAIELADGTIITGKTSELLGSCSAMLLNALKHLAGLPDEALLLSPEVIRPIQSLKVDHLGSKNPRLHTDEVLIALSVSAGTDPAAAAALAEIKNLRGCDVHTTTILGTVDETVFRNLGVEVTSEPAYQSKALFRK